MNSRKLILNNVLSYISDNNAYLTTIIINTIEDNNINNDKKLDIILDTLQDNFNSIKKYCININNETAVLNPLDNDFIK